MPSIAFELAAETDDAGLRRMLREHPIPGSISLSFEREPNYFQASSIEGPFHQTLVAREKASGEIVGAANRSVRPVFFNGQVQDIGYMSQLRIESRYGHGLYLARGLGDGFRLYRTLHADGRAPFYLMSIVEENLPARRLLASGLPGYPQVREYTRMFTYAVYPVRRRRALPAPPGLRIVRAEESQSQGIVDFLNGCGRERQFSPFWTARSLFAANLAPRDFTLAMDGERIAGCMACWDQTDFKQTVLRGYSGALARWRRLLNAFAGIGGWPHLPEAGTPLRHVYASHIAVAGQDVAVFAALLRGLYADVREQGYSYFVVGLAEADPFRRALAPYRPLTYISRIYLVAWPEDGALPEAGDRLPGLEIAVL